MTNKSNSLVHMKWLCKYKKFTIIEEHTMPDHVHLLSSVLPKLNVSSFGILRGKEVSE